MCRDCDKEDTDVWIGYNLDKLGADPHAWPWIDYYVSGIWWIAIHIYLAVSPDGASSRWKQVMISVTAGFFAAIPFVAILLAFLFPIGGWPILLTLNWDRLLPLATTTSGFWVLIVATTVGAFGLFFIRKKFQSFYGVAEVLFGIALIALGYYQAGQPPAGVDSLTHFKNLAVVIGGIYVIVRGLDNFGKGRDQAKRLINLLLGLPNRTEHPLGPPPAPIV